MEQSHRNLYALEDGTLVFFDCAKLNSAIFQKKNELEKNGQRFSKQRVMEGMAEETSISISAIKHWCAGRHSPSDLGKIRDIACALSIDMSCLLTKAHDTGKDKDYMSFDKLKDKTLDEIWVEILDGLLNELTTVAVDTWFRGCKLILFTEKNIVFAADSSFRQDVIRMRYSKVVQKVLNTLYSWFGEVSVIVDTSLRRF